MKTKHFLAASIAFLTGSMAVAQNISDYVNPASGVVNDQAYVYDVMENKYPGYKERVQEVFDRNKGFINMKSGIHDINVVVHVVYQDASQNLHDSVILNQIQILNDDYQRLNADTNNLRSIFQPIAGKPNFRFNLVHTERVSTTAQFQVDLFGGGLVDQVKSTADGGSDAWNTSNYLNIWICNIENQFGALFGYAYPPAGLSNWPANASAPSADVDGVVLDYRTVGSNNPNPYPNPQGGGNFVFTGRTATHEVGHYFGMRHIWGDGSIFGGDSCGEDDGITDTPNQGSQSNFDCDTQRNTCTDPSNDMPDLIENYMDYSDETCSNMWTQEQSAFMRNVIENERVGLLNPASVQEQEMANKFNLYPNPSLGNFNIIISEPMQQNGKIQVINVLGDVIDERQVPKKFQGKLGYQVPGLSEGVYIIRLQQGSQSFSKRLIVQ